MKKISFLAEIDSKKAQKQLDALNRKIATTTEQLNKAKAKRSDIETQLADAAEQADATKAKVQELRAELQRNTRQLNDNASRGIQGRENWDLRQRNTVIREQLAQQEALLQTQTRDVDALTRQWTAADGKVKQVTQTLTQQQTAAGALEQKVAQAYSGEKIQAAVAKLRKTATTGLKKLTESVSKGLKSAPKSLVKYMLGLRSLFALARKLRGAVTEGLNHLVQNDTRLNESLSSIKSGLSTVKNALGAAFAPVITAVAPLISKFCGMLTDAANSVARFFAILTGQSSYKKAIAVQEDYAASLSGTAGAAKEAEKYLSGLDEIQTYTDKSSGGGGGGSSAASSANAFAEEATNSAGTWAEQVKKAIGAGDWKGAGSLFAEKMNGVFAKFDGAKTAKTLSDTVKGGLEFAIGFLRDTDWVGLGKQIGDFFLNFDYLGVLVDLGELINEVFTGVIKFLAGLGLAIWEKLAPVGDVIKKWFDEKIKPWFTVEKWRKLATDAIAALESKISPKIDAIKQWWTDKIAPWFTKEKWQKLAADAKAALEAKISPKLDAIKTWYNEKIAPWFTSKKWQDLALTAKKGLEDKFNVTKDAVKTWFNDKIAPWFTSKKWQDLATTAKKSLEDKFSITIDSAKTWFEDKISPWFTAKKWQDLAKQAKEALTEKMTITVNAAKDWYNDKIKPWFTKEKWQNLGKTAIDAIKGALSLGTHNPVKTWWDTYVSPWFTAEKWKGLGKSAIDGIKSGLGSLALPKFSLTWETATKTFTILGKEISMNIPWPKLSFAARGGIVDGATYLGNGVVAGEAGKEAIVPLEKHTEWIKLVADGLADILIDRLGDFVARQPLPAVATGTLIPPRLVIDLPDLDAVTSEIRALRDDLKRGGDYRFTAQINRRTIFDEVISEARLRRSASGRNPFDI